MTTMIELGRELARELEIVLPEWVETVSYTHLTLPTKA